MNKTLKSFLAIGSFVIFISPSVVLSQINNPRNVLYSWKTDTVQRNIELSELSLVVPRKTFPSIDYPKFIGKEEGLDQFFKNEPVIAIAINGMAKAYPLNMLTMHEISNDTLNGVPILPTYCPLCNSSLVFDRRLSHKGKEYLLDFEVSGMLRNSDMVMADAQTETWWQQLMGFGLVGELAGVSLKVLPSIVISVQDFFERYPEGRILSPKTGTKSEQWYGTNPYKEYDKITGKPYESFFDKSKIDGRLPPMERIINLEGPNGYRVYPFSIIKEEGVINDEFQGKEIVIFYKDGAVSVLDNKEISKSKPIGSATMFSSVRKGIPLTFEKEQDFFIDLETRSKWDITGRCVEGEFRGAQLKLETFSNHFAFAWLAFHPDSEIYTKE
jgi:hypothetical protein